MKKNLIILLLSVLPCLLVAQHSLQSRLNMLRTGDLIFKQQVEYKDPGRSGADVLWDFSRLNIVNDEYELAYSTPDDTVITGTEHLTHYHYVLQSDSLLLQGFDNPTTQLRSIRPEVLLKFPFHHGDTIGSYYYAHGKYGNRLEMDVMGITQTVGDAYGMVILPGKDTLKHVLRTHTIKYITESAVPIGDSYFEKLESPLNISTDSIERRLAADTVLFIVETFRWYEKGYRYPIFETVCSREQYRHSKDYTFLNTAFFYPPQEHYYLNDDPENLELLEDQTSGESDETFDPWAGLTYNIYPNPVKTTPLQIEIYLPQAADVRVRVSNTMGWVALDAYKGYQSPGVYNFQLSLSDLPVGNYVLAISLNEKLISETVMKQ